MIVDTKDKILDLIKQDQNAKLNPELQQFLTDTPIGQYIKHPLVFQPFISTTIANQQLEQKYKIIQNYMKT